MLGLVPDSSREASQIRESELADSKGVTSNLKDNCLATAIGELGTIFAVKIGDHAQSTYVRFEIPVRLPLCGKNPMQVAFPAYTLLEC